jgi:hypothetical protein
MSAAGSGNVWSRVIWYMWIAVCDSIRRSANYRNCIMAPFGSRKISTISHMHWSSSRNLLDNIMRSM